jgi:hypothetical protein
MAGVPVRVVIAIEAGRGGEVRLNRIRSIFETLDAGRGSRSGGTAPRPTVSSVIVMRASSRRP